MSDLGNIRSIVSSIGRRMRVLSPCKTKWGYYQVVLTNANGLSRHESIHKLVLLSFVGLPSWANGLLGTRFLQANHKDEDKTNNRLENLEWCTPSYNSGYGTISERRLKTHKERKTVTSEAAIMQFSINGDFIREWKSLAEIERCTGMGKGYICSCCKGKYPHAYGFRWEYSDEWRKTGTKIEGSN